MNYLLDANAAIALINGSPEEVRLQHAREARSGGRFLIPTIVVFELRYGVARSARRARNTAVLDAFLALDFDVLPFEAADADIAGELRAKLRSRGTPIGPYDTLIAAQALRTGSTLVTANTREFSRVDGLKIENWAEPSRKR